MDPRRAAHRAFDRLGGADEGRELAFAEGPASKISACVAHPAQGEHQQHPASAVGQVAAQQGAEHKPDADVEQSGQTSRDGGGDLGNAAGAHEVEEHHGPYGPRTHHEQKRAVIGEVEGDGGALADEQVCRDEEQQADPGDDVAHARGFGFEEHGVALVEAEEGSEYEEPGPVPVGRENDQDHDRDHDQGGEQPRPEVALLFCGGGLGLFGGRRSGSHERVALGLGVVVFACGGVRAGAASMTARGAPERASGLTILGGKVNRGLGAVGCNKPMCRGVLNPQSA